MQSEGCRLLLISKDVRKWLDIVTSKETTGTKPRKEKGGHITAFRLTVAAQQTRTSYRCCPTRSSSKSHVVVPSGFVEFANVAGRRRRMIVLLGDNTSKSSATWFIRLLVEETADGVRKIVFSTFAQIGKVRHSKRPR